MASSSEFPCPVTGCDRPGARPFMICTRHHYRINPELRRKIRDAWQLWRGQDSVSKSGERVVAYVALRSQAIVGLAGKDTRNAVVAALSRHCPLSTVGALADGLFHKVIV